MTTIAYRDGVMAADSSLTVGETHVASSKKIFRLRNGSIIGFWGTWSHCMLLKDALNDGHDIKDIKRKRIKSAYAYLVKPHGAIWGIENGVLWQLIRTDYVAGGSGGPVALGALAQGASAVEAVRAAIEHAPGSKGPIHTLKLKR